MEMAERKENAKLPVLMSIRAEQDTHDGAPEQMEFLTGMELSYDETLLTGMAGTKTSLEIAGPRVTLKRSGMVSSHMVFEEGRQHTSLYDTPYGELSIDVQTSFLRHTLTERGGQMEIRYSISIEHATTGQNHFILKVKRKQ